MLTLQSNTSKNTGLDNEPESWGSGRHAGKANHRVSLSSHTRSSKVRGTEAGWQRITVSPGAEGGRKQVNHPGTHARTHARTPSLRSVYCAQSATGFNNPLHDPHLDRQPPHPAPGAGNIPDCPDSNLPAVPTGTHTGHP